MQFSLLHLKQLLSDDQLIVEYHSYRTAQVSDIVVALHAHSSTDEAEIDEILEHLLKLSNGKRNNHISFSTSLGLTFQYSDSTLYIALGLEIECW